MATSGIPTVNPTLAAVHFRVTLAGEAAEWAAQFLRQTPPHILMGRQQLQNVIQHVDEATHYLEATPVDPVRAAYLRGLGEWYRGELAKLSLIGSARSRGSVAEELSAAQGRLLAADPFF